MKNRTILLAACIALTPAALQAADRDPTRPIAYKALAKSTTRSGGLKLESLLISKQRRQATINGTVVREGDRIAGARVMTISSAGVTVERSGKRQQLSLNSDNVKTTTVKRDGK
ncbi:MAG: general secretion pathway protein GspB [Porticoccaceae bacterium]|nr:general secretion pathway protein GspB [Porticoccaceae bacterium]